LNATIDINEGGTLAPSGIVMRPYSLEAPAPGGDDVFTSERFRIGKGRYINLNDGANLAFQVDSQRTAPARRWKKPATSWSMRTRRWVTTTCSATSTAPC
jgi:hypothetical protein